MKAIVWQTGRVHTADQNRVEIQFDRLATCDACLRGEGCGAGVFARLFSTRGARLELSNDQALRMGQIVRVGLPGGKLVAMAALLYGLPVLAFVVGAVIVEAWLGHLLGADPSALLGGVLAGLAGFLLARRLPRTWLHPVVEKFEEPVACKRLNIGQSDSTS